jgi:hypothetical protein
MARPSVDGLERRIHDRANFARIDSTTDDGARIASRYGVTALPTYLLLDPEGRVLYRQTGGRPNADEIERRLARTP